MKSLIIVWDSRSRRAESLAAELDGQVIFQREDRLKSLWLIALRYLLQGWRTWQLLEQEQPEIVIVQSPPTIAPLLVDLWCMLRRRAKPAQLPYAIDCHTGTFHRPKWRWLLPLQRLLSQRAIVTLVTDRAAFTMLQDWNARCLFLEDALPVLSPAVGTIGSEGEARVGVISSLDDDEPIAEIFAAARLLPRVTFYVTGDSKKVEARLLARKPANVVLTGFLKGGTYTALLQNVHGLIVLTNEPHAVNCGAYEAAVMAKPVVVSDWPDLRHCFPRGFIHVNNTPEAIADGIQKMLNEREELGTEIIAMRSEILARRKPVFEEFVSLLGETVPINLHTMSAQQSTRPLQQREKKKI